MVRVKAFKNKLPNEGSSSIAEFSYVETSTQGLTNGSSLRIATD